MEEDDSPAAIVGDEEVTNMDEDSVITSEGPGTKTYPVVLPTASGNVPNSLEMDHPKPMQHSLGICRGKRANSRCTSTGRRAT